MHQVLCLSGRPQRLREDMRLRAAEVLDRFGIEAEALLDTTTRRTPLRSKWLLRDRLDMAVEEAYNHVES
ncbi:hypothetical protein ACERK3_17435 [Phycisphaerales bacterium AB-hyl4]|uniref:Uncharacterized protein n=1 Tax=Natronomicrosphaera hydrolytica TaxID=3242702 RepID=A0ABV4U8W7_9BACT